MLVRMRLQIQGARDLLPWPPPGGELEVPEDEGEQLIANGYAERVAEASDPGPGEDDVPDGSIAQVLAFVDYDADGWHERAVAAFDVEQAGNKQRATLLKQLAAWLEEEPDGEASDPGPGEDDDAEAADPAEAGSEDDDEESEPDPVTD